MCRAENSLAFIAVACSRVVREIWGGVQQVEATVRIKGQDTCYTAASKLGNRTQFERQGATVQSNCRSSINHCIQRIRLHRGQSYGCAV